MCWPFFFFFLDLQREGIISILKAILYLGNVKFISSEEKTLAESLDEESQIDLRRVARYLCLPYQELLTATTTKEMKMKNETLYIQLSDTEAVFSRDAFAKELYSRIFSNIITQINSSLDQHDSRNNESLRSIGILDVFGFEIFNFNSFEQLCINYANEKLQQLFLSFVIKSEQELYEREGINLSFLPPPDNLGIVEFFEARGKGFFSKLDEEIRLPKGSDESFLKKVVNESTSSDSPFKKTVRMKPMEFEIKHFAGAVRYDVSSFLEKNKDRFFDHFDSLLSKSCTSKIIREILLPSNSSNSSSQFNSISSLFQHQLQDLTVSLRQSTPHFIRCIKPNSVKRAGVFDDNLVLQQLKYSGVIEAISVRKNGYSIRKSLNEFADRFWSTFAYSKGSMNSLKDKSREIISKWCELQMNSSTAQDLLRYLSSDSWDESNGKPSIQIGSTLIFFRDGSILNDLEIERNRIQRAKCVTLQKVWRKYSLCKLKFPVWKRLFNDLHRLIHSCEQAFSLEEYDKLIKLMEDIDVSFGFSNKYLRVANDVVEKYRSIQKLFSELDVFWKDFQPAQIQKLNVVDLFGRILVLRIKFDDASKVFSIPGHKDQIEDAYEFLEAKASAIETLRRVIQIEDEEQIVHTRRKLSLLYSESGVFHGAEFDESEKALKVVSIENEFITRTIDSLERLILTRISLSPNNDALGNQWMSFEVVLKDLLTNLQTLLSKTLKKAEEYKMNFHEYILDRIKEMLLIFRQWSIRNFGSLLNSCHLLEDALANSVQILDLDYGESDISGKVKSISKNFKLLKSFIEIDVFDHMVYPILCELFSLPMINNEKSLNVSYLFGNFNGYENLHYDEWIKGEEKLLPFMSFTFEGANSLNRETLIGVFLLLSIVKKLAKKEKWVNILLLFTYETSGKYLWKGYNNAFLLAKADAVDFHLNPVFFLDDYDKNFDNDIIIIDNISRASNVETGLTRFRRYIADLSEKLSETEVLASLNRVSSSSSFNDDVNFKLVGFMCDELLFFYEESLDRYLQHLMHIAVSIPRFLCSMPINILSTKSSEMWNCVCNIIHTLPVEMPEIVHSRGSKIILKLIDFCKRIRESVDKKLWNDVIELCNTSEFMENFGSMLVDENWLSRIISNQNFSLICLEILRELGNDIRCVYSLSKSSVLEIRILSFLRNHVISNSESQYIDWTIVDEELANLQKLSHDLESNFTSRLLLLTKFIFEARKLFFLKDLATFESKKYAVRSIVDCIESNGPFTLPEEIRNELSSFQYELDINECWNLMLHHIGGGDVYFVIKSEKASQPCKRLSKFLDHEGYCFNENAVNIDQIDSDLKQAQKLLSSQEYLSRFKNFWDVVRALEYIHSLRTAVLNESWIEAYQHVVEIKTSGILDIVPSIESEIYNNEALLEYFSCLKRCQDQLSTNIFQFRDKFSAFSHVDLSDIEGVVELFEKFKDRSQYGDYYLSVLRRIMRLRFSIKNQDLKELSDVLSSFESTSSIAINYIDNFFQSELCMARIEHLNRMHSQSIATAIETHKLVLDSGLLITSLITSGSSELDTALEKASLVDESSIDYFLSALIALGSAVQYYRGFVKSGTFSDPENLRSYIEHEIQIFKENIMLDAYLESLLSVEVKSDLIENGVDLLATVIEEEEIDDGKSSDISVGSSSARQLHPPNSLYDVAISLVEVVESDIESITTHALVSGLENELMEGLQENGVPLEFVGSLDHSTISIDALALALNNKAALEKQGIKFGKVVRQLGKAAEYVVKVRSAILADEWDSLPGLLEEAVMGGEDFQIPDVCRQEMFAVRNEVENRWIINNITSALQEGKLEGVPGEVKLSSVSAGPLSSCVAACKAMHPKSDLAKTLLYTAEVMLPIRKLLCDDNVNWPLLRECVEGMLSTTRVVTLHPSILPELRLILATAEDVILCDSMQTALSRGRVTGSPGNLIYSTIDMKELDSILKLANEMNVKTAKAKHLLNACKMIRTLREALVSVGNSKNLSDNYDKWKNIRNILRTISDERQNSNQLSGWQGCRMEILLASREATVVGIREKLESSINNAILKYNIRNSVGVGEMSGKHSILSTNNLSTSDLDDILEKKKDLDFDCDALTICFEVASVLRDFRTALLTQNWEYFEKSGDIGNHDQAFDRFPIAKKEFSLLIRDYHNQSSINMLNTALRDPMRLKDIEEHLVNLNHVLEIVESYKPSSLAAKELFECSRFVYLLRSGFHFQIAKDISTSLRWFRSNSSRCPDYIQQEAQKAFIEHQNNLLEASFSKALSSGKASFDGTRMDFSSIETTILNKLLEKAKDMKDISPKAKDLIENAKIVYSIRVSQKLGDLSSIREILKTVEKMKNVHPLVIEEIALARSELENDTAMEILLAAIQKFVKDSNKSGEMDGRKYCLANFNSLEIDVESISVKDLDEAIQSAKLHGVYGETSKRYYRTVILLKDLRIAMKQSDWIQVENIFIIQNIFKNMGTTFDLMAEKELNFIHNQLNMRSVILSLSKALRNGWATCFNGIVDTSTISVGDLIDNISRAGARLEGLKREDANFSDTHSYSTRNFNRYLNMERELSALVDSSNKILKIRELLNSNLVEEAAAEIENALQEQNVHKSVVEELTYYSEEIAEVMKMTKLGESLKKSIMGGDVEKLREEIDEACRMNIHRSCDLGLIRLLQYATDVYKQWLKFQSNLKRLIYSYDIHAMKSAIDDASSHNIKDPTILELTQRRAKLVEFEKAVADLKMVENYIISDIEFNKKVLVLSDRFGFQGHPLTARSELMLKLSFLQRQTWCILHAIVSKDPLEAACTTMLLKYAFHQLPENIDRFPLIKYPNLRKPEAFFVDHASQWRTTFTIESIISSSDQDIPTSLTNLDPLLSSLAVWMFSNDVLSIQRGTALSLETCVKNILVIGIHCPLMRDEIYLQIMKQLNVGDRKGEILDSKNGSVLDALPQFISREDSIDRLWRLFGICLTYFPPSHLLENYMERFLLDRYTDAVEEPKVASSDVKKPPPSSIVAGALSSINRTPKVRSIKHVAAKMVLRLLHESVFKFGNTRRSSKDLYLYSMPNIPMKSISLWFSDAYLPSLKRRITATPNGSSLERERSYISKCDEVQVRCCVQDWKQRFESFATCFGLVRKETGKDVVIQKDQFISICSCIKDVEICDMDRLDFFILKYVLFGTNTSLISRNALVIRELIEDYEIFRFSSQDSSSLQLPISFVEMTSLYDNLVEFYRKFGEMSTNEPDESSSSSNENANSLEIFWETCVVEVCDNNMSLGWLGYRALIWCSLHCFYSHYAVNITPEMIASKASNEVFVMHPFLK